jgi:hypothetical protein
MADDPTSTTAAYARQTMDSAFETVENVPLAANDNFERQVMVVSARLTPGHRQPPACLT